MTAARLDHMLAAFGEAAIAVAAPAARERVLDVGCGAGSTSFALAACVGAEGCVLGVDISEPLIARARKTAQAGAPVAFELAAASRAALPAQGFDLLFSRFGVLFFDYTAAAFSPLREGPNPGARLAVACCRAAPQ